MIILALLAAIAIIGCSLGCAWTARHNLPRRSRPGDVGYIAGRWRVAGEQDFTRTFKRNGVGYDVRGGELVTFGYTIAGERVLLSQDAVLTQYRIVERKTDRMTLRPGRCRDGERRTMVLERVCRL